MKNIKQLAIYSALFIAGSAAPSLVSVVPSVDINTAYAETKTKRVPALREKVYSQLARAQKLADDGDVKAGLEALDSIKERSSSMNSYEIAMMYNFYGFIYYNENQLDKAIASFENVVAEEGIPESLRLSTTFSLAQLAMANSEYNKVIKYLDSWESINKGVTPDNYYVLRAQANYQLKDYQEAVKYINTAIGLSESKGDVPNENWLVLQRALYYSLNQPKKVTEVLEKMVKLYNKPNYWIQLAGMYGEIGDEKQQLAIFEAADQQGFVKSRSEIKQLAQVYMYNGLAYKAAKLMERGLSQGTIENNAKNQAFIAESLVQAKEDNKAIQYFAQASKLVEHGNYDQRLAEIYINLEMFDEAADAARAALDKGQLTFESNAYVALGMAQYNLQNFDASILAFEQAEKHKKSANLAKQWIKYVKREKLHNETLKQVLL
ncbi:tetratricopeptide repeat protein [Pseudoalteromonas sp. JBTF-M23]|uniref:Tetratricopeptide repeat protein n=1 Tax=Pseudoalteromonas caenipelagi TaxID=2726988 RepID=A0A849VBR1_9GAMM|nr:CDC27 family protein [Pseudoalteromonas caenipelagi]NOU50220.1 tetratricopeptide repeat protein [Pseudoalteromonas caenipelagi]